MAPTFTAPEAPSMPSRRQGKAVQRRTRMRGGAGAGPGATGSTPSASFGDRLRYRMDNALARGPFVVIGYLAALSLAIVLVASVVSTIAHFTFGGANGESFGEDLWQNMLRTLDAGSFAADADWGTRSLALVVTLAGIFLAGSLIGLIANAVDQKVEDLRKGKSAVLEAGHTLVLGWSPAVPRILGELIIANESARSAAVVVLARTDKTVMEDTLRSELGDTGSTKVICRSGSPSSPDDLRRAAIGSARSIIAVRGDDGDAGVVKAVLAVRAVDPTMAGAHVVAELAEADYARTIRAVSEGAVLTVASDDVVAEVTAQACLQSGLAAVFSDLLDFDGDEIYFTPAGPLDGHTYAEAMLAFERSSVIGILSEDGVVLNPDAGYTLRATDQLVVVAADDSAVQFTGLADPPPASTPVPAWSPSVEPLKLLIVGWSAFGAKVVRELDDFLPSGSTIAVSVDAELAPEDSVDVGPLVNSTLSVRVGDGGPDDLLRIAEAERPDQVIVLGYRDALSVDDADARTLLSLLTLRQAWPEGGPDPVRVVAELLDQANLPLAVPVGVDDLIVSDALASLLMAQLSEHAELLAVFDELFDAHGSSCELRPASAFVADEDVTFGQVVAAASAAGASAFGYRIGATRQVVINPPKSARVRLGAGDQVAVLASR